MHKSIRFGKSCFDSHPRLDGRANWRRAFDPLLLTVTWFVLAPAAWAASPSRDGGDQGFAANFNLDCLGNPSTNSGPIRGIPTPITFEDDGPLFLSRIADASGDQGTGPSYGDTLKSGVTGSGSGVMKVGQKINGTFPPVPTGDIGAWSWRFDTDLNPNTGYQQFPYIGIEWEILILDGGGFWTVTKWSQSTGYLPVASARVQIKHGASGDKIFVTFDPAEIGSPISANWITWNGYYPTWFDLAPDASVAFWMQ